MLPLERTRSRTGEHGFTLIELLVVIVIIGILLAIAVPSYLGYQDRSEDTVAKTNAASMVRFIEQCRTIEGGYIGKCDSLGLIEAANGGPNALKYGWAPGEVEVDPCTEANPPNPNCPGGADGYFVIAKSKSGNTFWIYHWTGLADGPKKTCATAGKGGCRSDGTW